MGPLGDAYDITPYVPTAASSSASPENMATSDARKRVDPWERETSVSSEETDHIGWSLSTDHTAWRTSAAGVSGGTRVLATRLEKIIGS